MPLALGSSAPNFSLPATTGETVALADLGDGPRLIVFTCNHCPYAKAWEGRLIEIGNDYRGRIGMAAICSNDVANYPADSFEKMRELAAAHSYSFPYLHDESQAVASAYQAQHTPEVFLFDAGGSLVYTGAVDDSVEAAEASASYLRDAIDTVLAGGSPQVASTKAVGCTIKWAA
ncbi:MAG: thioredoxin family protein [Chloroflexota bacterium]|nr:thioredoxin family protein [Chloroflexota bacterium]MXX65999.1 thioredoxin family protein [Chloroflexota bacterium]